jgi:demethylsterigmatocystin 6-O-methyltransferase
MHSSFDNCGPVFQKLPDFLKETKYQPITDNTKCVLQPAWKINVPAFIWLQQNPERFANFQQYMMQQRQGMPTWLSVYPVEKETKSWSPEHPIFVDVGGGLGHQCAALKGKYPKLPGRVILQDLPPAIQAAITTTGVENTIHDFFRPQPIKGMIPAVASFASYKP